MQDPKTPRRSGLVWLACVGMMAGLLGILILQQGSAPPQPAVSAGGDVAPGSTLLKPSREPLCDPERMARMQELLHAVAPGEVRVDAADWQRRGTSLQVGLASWISKCVQEGGPVRILGHEAGELLAVYDAHAGYRTAD